VEQQGYKTCASLMLLADRYTPQSLEQACKRALSFTSSPSLKNISIILKNEPEKPKDEKVATCTIGIHKGWLIHCCFSNPMTNT